MNYVLRASRSLYPLCLSSLIVFSPDVLAEGRVQLTVVDAASQRPLNNATIVVRGRKGRTAKLSSGAGGEGQLSDLPAGLYEIRVQHVGFVPERLPSVRVIDEKTTVLEVELDKHFLPVEETLVVADANAFNASGLSRVASMDREALRSAAGSGGDVLRSLDGLPGLFSDGEFSNYTVRGNGPRDNLILVDGIPFPNVVHFSDSFGEQEELEGGGRYSVFAPNVIKKADYQPGGWGAEHGGPAGSLLNLEVGYGNTESAYSTLRFDIAGLEVGYEGPSGVHDDSSILFSARSLDFGQLFSTVGIDDVGEPKLTDVIFKSHTELGDVDTLKFLTIVSSESFYRGVEHGIASDDNATGEYTNTELIDAEKSNQLFMLTWERFIGEQGKLSNKFFMKTYDESSNQGESYPGLSPLGAVVSDVLAKPNLLFSKRNEVETGWRLDFSTENVLGTFSSGLEATSIDLDFSLDLSEDWIRYTFDQGDTQAGENLHYVVWTEENTDNRYQQSEINIGTYLDQAISFGDWEVHSGVRIDNDAFSDQQFVSPRASSTWYVSNGLRLSSTVGRYYQAPSYSERAADGLNSQLKNAYIDQVSVGLKWDLASYLNIFVEPYYQKQQDLIVEGDGTQRSRVNTGEGRSFGVDTALNKVFSNGWSANMTYSYNDSKIKTHTNGDYLDSDYNRPHAVSVGGIWEINERWKLSARWKWASGRPKDAFIVYENVLGDNQPLRYSRERIARNTSRHDGYSSFNFRADYRRALGRTNIISFIDIVNLLGAENPSESEFNERTGLDVVEEGEALPILGFRLEW